MHLDEILPISAHNRSTIARAYPGLEFVLANTLAEWKRLEPNEIIFSQDFSQKVSRSYFVFNSLPAMSADNLCKQF